MDTPIDLGHSLAKSSHPAGQSISSGGRWAGLVEAEGRKGNGGRTAASAELSLLLGMTETGNPSYCRSGTTPPSFLLKGHRAGRRYLVSAPGR